MCEWMSRLCKGRILIIWSHYSWRKSNIGISDRIFLYLLARLIDLFYVFLHVSGTCIMLNGCWFLWFLSLWQGSMPSSSSAKLVDCILALKSSTSGSRGVLWGSGGWSLPITWQETPRTQSLSALGAWIAVPIRGKNGLRRIKNLMTTLPRQACRTSPLVSRLSAPFQVMMLCQTLRLGRPGVRVLIERRSPVMWTARQVLVLIAFTSYLGLSNPLCYRDYTSLGFPHAHSLACYMQCPNLLGFNTLDTNFKRSFKLMRRVCKGSQILYRSPQMAMEDRPQY